RTCRPQLENLEAREVPTSSPLHVVGNQLQDAANHTVVLRGVNVPSLDWRPDGSNLTTAANTAISWGANLLRPPAHEAFRFGHDQKWTGAEAGDGGAASRAPRDPGIETALHNN